MWVEGLRGILSLENLRASGKSRQHNAAVNKPTSTEIKPIGAFLSAALLLAVSVFWPSSLFSAPAENPNTSLGRFALHQDEVVVFTGGANMVASQQNAFLETLLTAAFAQRNARFRSLAWEGDTVFEQRREMNFGSWQEQLRRVKATLIFAQFGQMESFQGAASLPEFRRAYEKLLDQFSNQMPQIVLLSPTPFEKPKPPLPDLSRRNCDVQLYAEAVRDLARARGCWFVDLFAVARERPANLPPLTSDGLQLTPAGHWLMAREIASQLGFLPLTAPIDADLSAGTLRPETAEHLRQVIQAKNRLWFDYWRPMNWAFLHGDRTEQPSSRDHRDPKIRWFPDEMERFPPLIEAKERQIARLTASMPSALK